MKPFLKKILISAFLIFCSLLTFENSYSITDTLDSKLDNTLYEDDFGSLSNGAGEYFFAGTTISDKLRRGLIAFDVSSNIPPGAVVTSVKLILHMSRTISDRRRIALHKASRQWGEGNSDAHENEGGGAPSEPGDATWIHTFYNTALWTNAGGDFSATESAATNVDAIGFYEWTDPQMTADVQAWVNNSQTDFGWVLIGDESTVTTSKRFDTKENIDSAFHPRLIVTYTINKVILKMRAFVEGFVGSTLQSAAIAQTFPDTFRVYLRTAIAPYSIVDSAKAFTSAEAWYVFNNAPSGSYYIMVRQRNSINTWSKVPQSFTVGIPKLYDFTTAATQAFGNNLVLKNGSYCIYSGDVNKDNFVNLTDVLSVYNAAAVFQAGYNVNDVNGDSIVDLTDIIITYNNSIAFVQEKRP